MLRSQNLIYVVSAGVAVYLSRGLGWLLSRDASGRTYLNIQTGTEQTWRVNVAGYGARDP
ncbi:hypothetical protein CONPUDRAFT_81253 [Coniophora puteana RWD-64-598 SS2]|uniref:Uncharacterized protein n=1 Tax=Coniophora puteana (strain RWD-64-598) TaxID=741705 RepID=A0A5M3MVZ8_CONPW|nr:uncharacterized protein CONPUDRAFT_81253 [Coniophora puteana RWD-64-598 SS2]EIW83230.1 hypothetical protein CONPUDRAFT_81253 [Coniophora puteana RWD-64-598 SS2]